MIPKSIIISCFQHVRTQCVCIFSLQSMFLLCVYTCCFLCTGELSNVHSELEQQMSRALQEKQALELKLAQVERNAQQTLITTQQSHQEQLHTERKHKVSLKFWDKGTVPNTWCVIARSIHFWFDSKSVKFIINLIWFKGFFFHTNESSFK